MASSYQPETAAVPARRLPTLHEFFAPGGLLSKAHPNYEFRRGQLQMAEAVEQAIHERKHLIVEAGTGRIAQFGNIIICGKTGTAQNPHGKDHSLFVAFAPRDNPKIAIAVMVENAGFGAEWAAPVASLMMEQYLNDSISRPQLYERIMNGNLLPTRQDSLIKKTDKPKVPVVDPLAQNKVPD